VDGRESVGLQREEEEIHYLVVPEWENQGSSPVIVEIQNLG
jgi:nucleoid-associated protein YgaU